jgi:hypothetical protein
MKLAKNVSCLVFAAVLIGSASTSDPLAIDAIPVSGRVSVGTKILLRIIITNKSNHEISFHDTRRDCDYVVNVFRSNGESAPETDVKKQLKCTGEFKITGRDIVVQLQPGESHEDCIDLTRLAEMEVPDTYSVQVARTFPDIGTFSSNIIKVSVTR